MRIQAVSQMTREIATMAFFFPRFFTIRRYWAPSRVSVRPADMAAVPRTLRSQLSPLPVRPGLDWFPDWSVRGVSRAQAAA